MVQTVEENKKHFSERAYKRAMEARRLYQIIGTPSLKDYKTIIQSNLIKNYAMGSLFLLRKLKV